MTGTSVQVLIIWSELRLFLEVYSDRIFKFALMKGLQDLWSDVIEKDGIIKIIARMNTIVFISKIMSINYSRRGGLPEKLCVFVFDSLCVCVEMRTTVEK